jgi:hypothetical protein
MDPASMHSPRQHDSPASRPSRVAAGQAAQRCPTTRSVPLPGLARGFARRRPLPAPRARVRWPGQRRPRCSRRSTGVSSRRRPHEAAGRQRTEVLPAPASVRSSSRIAGVFAPAMARSSARRLRAACRRCRQLDVTLLMVTASFIEVDAYALSNAGCTHTIPTNHRYSLSNADVFSPGRVRVVTPRAAPAPGPARRAGRRPPVPLPRPARTRPGPPSPGAPPPSPRRTRRRTAT